jgi:hypothetical protein
LTSNSNNKNPFVSDTMQQFWQDFIANWYSAYGEFFKMSNKMTEYWYNTYWKPWLDWQRQMQQRGSNRDKVDVE